MIQALIKLPRIQKQLIIILFDIGVVIGSILASFSIRLGYFYLPPGDDVLRYIIFAAPLLALPIFFSFKLYHQVVRYLSFQALWKILQAVSLYAILWGLTIFMLAQDGIPRSVILINLFLVLLGISGSRFFVRWLIKEIDLKNNFLGKINVMIYGAGSAGRQLSKALIESKEYNPIGFIDDSIELINNSINGLEIFSRTDLADLISRKKIKEVLLAMPSLPRASRTEIVNYLEPYPIVVRSLPGVSELAQGRVKVNDLLEIDIRDLLGRDAVTPNNYLLKTNITNKIVLVTGAGGSIGSELCRQIVLLEPKKLLLFDVSESSLYQIDQELESINFSKVETQPIMGSVVDPIRMKLICSKHSVQTIYHAAAYKHVPLVEQNPSQGILNNIFGTMVAAEAAIATNVETFVLISTDKAVRPTSVMGASKRAAELVLQAFDKQNHNTCFTIVRFGNVLDSSGSVIPLFKKQINAGGPVTVTHSDIVRYFMTIPEAVELVIQAGAMAKGGEVFLLDMGEPIRIYDLAVKMIQLSGLQVLDENNPEGDIQIKYTGLRPGEKLYEELLLSGNYTFTENKLIMRAEEDMLSWEKLKPILITMKEAATNSEIEKSYKLLKQLVPEFNLTTNNL